MPKRFVILTAGRSASSQVAKGLHLAGVPMGDDRITQPQPGNDWGDWEDREVVELNTQMLKASGADYYHPTSISSGPVADLVNERTGTWGFKDPRTAWTWDAWEPHLGDDPILVCVYRKPRNAARSLAERDSLDEAAAHRLVRRYNDRIHHIAQRFTA